MPEALKPEACLSSGSIWRMARPLRTLSFAFCALAAASAAPAEVVKLTVEQRQPFANAKLPYEKLTGRFFGELDPKLPQNAVITDIELAPRNARGMVEYLGHLHHPQAGGHEQGHRRPGLPGAEPGPRQPRGWRLLRRLSRRRSRAGGERLAGRHSHRCRRRDDGGARSRATATARASPDPRWRASTTRRRARRRSRSFAAGSTGTATPASLDTTKATLTRRTSEEGARVPIAATAWAFADCSQTPFPGKPDPDEAVPQGRLRSGVALRAHLRGQGSAGARHRLRRHARSDGVPAAPRRRPPARRVGALTPLRKAIRSRATTCAAS